MKWLFECSAPIFGAVVLLAQGTGGVPAVDKTKLASYLRYAEGYTAQVQFSIDDAKPSSIPGLYQVDVHLSAGTQTKDDTYYTPDGQRFFTAGPIYDLHQNPFRENIEKLKPNGPSFGPQNAKVTIYVFSDFECPYCREEAKVLRQNVQQHYAKDVRVIFKDFPLESIHPWAKQAAEAGRCIAKQSETSFWAFHDWVYEHQQEVTKDNVRQKVDEFAKAQPGLKAPEVSACMAGNSTLPEIEKSLAEARALAVNQTPTLFVNGRMVAGALPWNQLETIIKLELDRPQEVATTPSIACCEVPGRAIAAVSSGRKK